MPAFSDEGSLTPDTLVQFQRTGIEVGPRSMRLRDLYMPDGRAMTPDEIREAFALPQVPTQARVVLGYPAGAKFFLSVTAPNRFGSGGAVHVFAEGMAEVGESYTITELVHLLRRLRIGQCSGDAGRSSADGRS